MRFPISNLYAILPVFTVRHESMPGEKHTFYRRVPLSPAAANATL
ncbi:hypothetical protein NT01EI_0865 [Edwardsiella ictaluri 93-146]|uniref:Uncharacterized protein n=1 Tax=Edwardsiella ictaluri (strain 93-146) TaxID=634503 RepID=C5B7T4_EDWI9|nr:hypothetical protein NT01EI_0865 [Edwardsiella ictaluri 93-146]